MLKLSSVRFETKIYPVGFRTKYNLSSGMHVVGKGSWKDREVDEFLVGKFVPSSSSHVRDHYVGNLSN